MTKPDSWSILDNNLATVRLGKVGHRGGVLVDQREREIPAGSLDGTALAMLLKDVRITLGPDGVAAEAVAP
ncbi:hypothetical protein [Nocardia sp. SC052]|uniref:hypothetical protein n=1 Tax=Nocardia sichangensis TaxID=3385975 RepID=UPI0039A03476